MTIYEKLERIDAISEETKVIESTLEAIRYLLGTGNITTVNRCMVIAGRLNDRAETLHNEFLKLKSEIESELGRYYD